MGAVIYLSRFICMEFVLHALEKKKGQVRKAARADDFLDLVHVERLFYYVISTYMYSIWLRL